VNSGDNDVQPAEVIQLIGGDCPRESGRANDNIPITSGTALSTEDTPSGTVRNENQQLGVSTYTFHCSTDHGNKVRGVCVIGDKLYVIREGNSDVQIYDRLTLKFIDRLPVLDNKHPNCMTLDSIDECLYITYDTNSTVRRVPLDGKNTSQWNTSSTPGGICVAANSQHVIVALPEEDKVVWFTPGGTVVKTFHLPQGTHPRSVLSVLDDKLYMSTGSDIGHVCVLGNDGTLTKIETKTSRPFSLAKDSRGNILVADYTNGQVVLFDIGMNCVSEVIPKTGGVKCPIGLCYDERYEVLYVGEFSDNGRVIAYKVS
jgi:hypothetical protein